MRILSAVLGILLIAGAASAQEDELQSALKEARSHGAQSFEVARALALLGIFYQDVGRFAEAESCFLRSLKIVTGINGGQDESQVLLISRLASIYVETGRTADARRLHLESWADRLAASRSDYLPLILESVGGLYALEGNFRAADEIFHKDFDLLVERGYSVSVNMASALNNFGFVELKLGRYSDALNLFSKALPMWRDLAGFDNLEVAITRAGLAETYAHLARYDDSNELLAKALPVFEAKCGPRSLRTAHVLSDYAKVLRHQNRKTEAKRFEDRANRIREQLARDPKPGAVIDLQDLASYRGRK
jgi:tetratricopeptide (TPR) repeat protein